jgi:hypothetical protein
MIKGNESFDCLLCSYKLVRLSKVVHLNAISSGCQDACLFFDIFGLYCHTARLLVVIQALPLCNLVLFRKGVILGNA